MKYAHYLICFLPLVLPLISCAPENSWEIPQESQALYGLPPRVSTMNDLLKVIDVGDGIKLVEYKFAKALPRPRSMVEFFSERGVEISNGLSLDDLSIEERTRVLDILREMAVADIKANEGEIQIDREALQKILGPSIPFEIDSRGSLSFPSLVLLDLEGEATDSRATEPILTDIEESRTLTDEEFVDELMAMQGDNPEAYNINIEQLSRSDLREETRKHNEKILKMLYEQ